VERQQAVESVRQASAAASSSVNAFSARVFKTRGGRMGSSMGALLEALWGYYVNQQLSETRKGAADCELAWMVGHQYSDFACVSLNEPWDSSTLRGELFRIEVKSMNIGADESKGHFDQVIDGVGEWDQLLVLVWLWEGVDEVRVCPKILDYYFGSARAVARLRDELHITRGGSFVDRSRCPDGCDPSTCQHHGEPLNADGRRERKSGPVSRRVSQDVSYASNFGGLVRMLKTSSNPARRRLRELRAEDEVADGYIAFIHRIFPNEERNHYTIGEWRLVAQKLGVDTAGLGPDDVVRAVRAAGPLYRELFRSLPTLGE